MKIITTVRINLTVDVQVNSSSKLMLPLERVNDEAVAAATREVDQLISELDNVRRVPGDIRVIHMATESKL